MRTLPGPMGGPVTQTITLPSARRSPEGPPATAGPARDAYFDNAKLLAIVLVFLGHAWEPLTAGSRTAQALYMLVYAFHMPAFIVVSGYFSRSFDHRPDRLKRLVTGVAVPYVVFETAYSVFKRYADDDPGHAVSLLDPWYLTWFLVALLLWRLTAPVWRLVRYPVAVALAIAVLAVTSQIGDDLDLQRVLQFLPFFVVGLCMRPEHFRRLRDPRLRPAAVAVFAVALAFAYWAAPRMTSAWLYHRDSAVDLGASPLAGAAMTVALFGCSMVLTLAFLALVPDRRLPVTSLGTGTLCAYLLHGFVVQASRFGGWYDHGFVHTPLGALGVTAVAVAGALLLCSAPARTVFRPVLEPRMEWFFRGAGGSGRGFGRGAGGRLSRRVRTRRTCPRRRNAPPT